MNDDSDAYPAPGSVAERRRFSALQQRLGEQFQRIFPDPKAPRTVLVVPSLSLDPVELTKIAGVSHYEERLLCMLMLLRLPRTRLVFLTSLPVDPAIIDYYLHLLPGIPSNHARRRLTMLHCHDGSMLPLAQKILDRPRLLARIRAALEAGGLANTHMSCFSVSALERTLAVRLGIPLYGCDPALADLGSKSGSREIFRAADVALPDGRERLRDRQDIADALIELKRRDPALGRAVVKLNEGFSGEGNATFSYQGCPPGAQLAGWVKRLLPQRLAFEAAAECWESYCGKLAHMGGIVECFVAGETVRSPSVQCRIDPLGHIDLISTHDQVLGGPSGQVFLGCTFPADSRYRQAVQDAGLRVAAKLAERGVLGRFGVDFIAVRNAAEWRCYAIEINLRKGGTTHTYMMLQFLTDGRYDPGSGVYTTPSGQSRCYYATDNLQNDRYRGLSPDDLIDIAVDHDLHFHGATQEGAVFHLIGALSEYGKFGMVCVADSVPRAQAIYNSAIAVLDRET